MPRQFVRGVGVALLLWASVGASAVEQPAPREAPNVSEPVPELPPLASAELPLAPPVAVEVKDKPNDDATAIDLAWRPSPSDTPDSTRVMGYVVRRADAPGGPFAVVGRVFTKGEGKFTDSAFSWKSKDREPPEPEAPSPGEEEPSAEPSGGIPTDPPAVRADPRGEYYYEVAAFGLGEGRYEESAPSPAGPIAPREYWLDRDQINVLVTTVLCTVVVLGFLGFARRGRDFYVRPIAGLKAVDDAIGRATEMGRPLLFVAGLGGVSDIATVAAMAILGRIGRTAAEQGTRILVPCRDPMVMTAQREVVKESYLEAGKPDAYVEDDIYFTTDSQFAYVASVAGTMARERPAACFYMGYFYAEALILAEAGAMAGCIQIAGTDAVMQLPFLVTTCDYTLMGEELYAATAYLTREPRLLGSLKAQDWLKMAVAVALVGGVVFAGLGQVLHLPETSWMLKFISLFETK